MPSYDFFDVFNVNERPRNSENSTTTLNPPSEIVPGTRPTVELDNTFFEVISFEISDTYLTARMIKHHIF